MWFKLWPVVPLQLCPPISNAAQDCIAVDDDSVVPPVSKKRKVVNEDYVNEADELYDSVWIQVYGATLKSSDKLILLKGNEINDELLMLCKRC